MVQTGLSVEDEVNSLQVYRQMDFPRTLYSIRILLAISIQAAKTRKMACKVCMEFTRKSPSEGILTMNSSAPAIRLDPDPVKIIGQVGRDQKEVFDVQAATPPDPKAIRGQLVVQGTSDLQE